MSPGIDHSANSQRQPHINNTITQLWILALSQPFNLVITHWENANSVIANMSLLLTPPSTCQPGRGSRTTTGSLVLPRVQVSGPVCSPTVPRAQSGTRHQGALWGCGHSCVGQGEELGRQGREMCRGEPIVVTHSRGWGRAGLWGTGGVRGGGTELELGVVSRGIQENLTASNLGIFLNFFPIFWILVT